MAVAVIANISVEGSEPLRNYISIAIRQELFAHHSFRIVVPYEALETARSDQFFHQAHQRYCGKQLTINLVPRQPAANSPLLFKGIITHIGIENSADFNGRFVLSGYSLSYLLEDGTQRRTFQKKRLHAIFSQVLQDYPANLVQTVLNPQHQEPVKYIVQYAESNYAFLRRLANMYGEWFYYDGQVLQMGRPTETTPLKYTVVGTEEFAMDLELLPARFQLGRYDYLAHAPYAGSSENQSLPFLNPFAAFALQASERLFAQPARLMANRSIRNSEQLNTTVRQWKASQTSQLVTFQGSGENPGFSVGKTIEVAGGVAPNQHDYGCYRLTEVTHWVENDMYHNKFTALPATAEAPGANAYVQPPMGVPEMAEVIDVADPKRLGRIKVRFHWLVASPADAESGWLRVSTPYAGDGKGHLFTPEVGSQVLVGYEQNIPDFAVVLGNLFHAHNKQDAYYTTPGNHLKGLQTAGGNKVVLLDTPGEQTILISNSNNKGTAVQLDFKGDGSITIKSNGAVKVLSPTIVLEAGDKGEISLHAKTITLAAEDDLHLAGKKTVTASGENIALEATGTLASRAREKTITTTQGIQVDGGALVDVQAVLVKINS